MLNVNNSYYVLAFVKVRVKSCLKVNHMQSIEMRRNRFRHTHLLNMTIIDDYWKFYGQENCWKVEKVVKKGRFPYHLQINQIWFTVENFILFTFYISLSMVCSFLFLHLPHLQNLALEKKWNLTRVKNYLVIQTNSRLSTTFYFYCFLQFLLLLL